MELTEDQVLKAVYESGLHQYAPTILTVKWKDGIDINVPSSSLMNFVGKLSTPSPSAEHVECLCSDCMEDAEISDIEHTDKATSAGKLIAALKKIETDDFTTEPHIVAREALAAYQKEQEL